MRRRVAILAAVSAIAALVVSFVVRPPAVPRDAEPPPAVDAVAWNGVDWRQPPDPFPAGDPVPIRIDGLTAGGGLVLGWGRVAAQGRNQFNNMGGVFVTRDGERWRSIALDDGVGLQDTSEPYGIGIGPSGLLAFGGVCCAAQARAFWHSADGLRWTRMAIEGDLKPDDSVVRVVGVPTGWVAVGSMVGRAAIWSSADGQTWTAIPAGQAGLGEGSISDVAVAGDQLIAVGTLDDAARTHDGGVWVSDDAKAWKRVAAGDVSLTGPDETELWRVVPFSAGLFMVGNHGPHEERVQCEQLLGGGMASVAAVPPPQTALSCGWGREHHWLSADASAWLRLPPRDPLPGQPAPAGLRPNEFRLVGAGGPGIVNLAEDSQPPDGDSAIWVSADGRAWRRLDTTRPLRPAAGALGFAMVGRTIIAVGDVQGPDGSRPTIWIGRVL